MKKTAKICKRILTFTVLFALLAGVFPFAAQNALSAEKPQKSGMQELKEQAGDKDPFAPEEGYKQKTRKTMPETFDLRHVVENGTETSYITPVKVQNPYGTCWGFAAVAAAESSLLSSGLAAQRGYDADTLDLSEKQIAWFATNPLGDPENPQYGEGAVFKEGSTPQDKYNAGGGVCFATNLFATGVGPVDESTETPDGKIFAYRGKNGEVNSEYVTWTDENGDPREGIRKTSYSDEDDWTIPEEYRFYHTYRLKESYLLPNPIDSYGEYCPEATEAIKEQLLNKRAVSISIMASHSVAGEDESLDGNSILSANWAQYSEFGGQNHVVTIVGYDDNYPAENFVKGNQPPANGAWLVKNSWGSDLNEFPNNGYAHWGLFEGQDLPGGDYTAVSDKHTGYFWLSYYDGTINGPEAYVFEIADDDLTYNQHDYLPVVEYGEYATETENRMCNVFTAAANEELKEVSVFTATPGTKVTYQVYLLAENAETPEDGICVAASAEKEYPFGGYHRETVNAENGVYLCKGQKYAIVVTEKTPAGKYSISFGKSYEEPRHESDPRMFHSVINKGESFLYIDGEWRDLSDEEILNTLLVDQYGYVWNVCADNFPIKAFTAPSDSEGAYLVVTNRNKYNITDTITLKKPDEMPLIAQFKGATDELTNDAPEIAWGSTDPAVFAVAQEEGNPFRATITALSPGTAFLKVSAGKYGTRIIKVNVRKFEVLSAAFPEDLAPFVFSGDPFEPKLDSVYAETEDEYEYDYDLEEGTDYTVTYHNNVLCGRATATVKGIGRFGGTVENYEFTDNLSFLIVPSKAEIESTTWENGTLTVHIKPQEAEGITGYFLSYQKRGDDTATRVTLDASAASAEIGGLTPDETYKVWVCAYVTTYDCDAIYNEEWDYYDAGYADHSGEDSDTVTVTLTSASADDPAPSDDPVPQGILSFLRRIIEIFRRFICELKAVL